MNISRIYFFKFESLEFKFLRFSITRIGINFLPFLSVIADLYIKIILSCWRCIKGNINGADTSYFSKIESYRILRLCRCHHSRPAACISYNTVYRLRSITYAFAWINALCICFCRVYFQLLKYLRCIRILYWLFWTIYLKFPEAVIIVMWTISHYCRAASYISYTSRIYRLIKYKILKVVCSTAACKGLYLCICTSVCADLYIKIILSRIAEIEHNRRFLYTSYCTEVYCQGVSCFSALYNRRPARVRLAVCRILLVSVCKTWARCNFFNFKRSITLGIRFERKRIWHLVKLSCKPKSFRQSCRVNHNNAIWCYAVSISKSEWFFTLCHCAVLICHTKLWCYIFCAYIYLTVLLNRSWILLCILSYKHIINLKISVIILNICIWRQAFWE